MKKRALVVTGSLRMGGLERVAINCVKYSDHSLYSFDFLVYGNKVGELEKEAKDLGCNIIRTKSISQNFLKFYREICRIMHEYGPYDIVHSHMFFNSGIILIALRIAHSHSIKRKNESIFKKIVYHPLMRYSLSRYSTKICACSEMAGEYLFGKNRFLRQGIIIPNIIELEKFSLSNERDLLFFNFIMK